MCQLARKTHFYLWSLGCMVCLWEEEHGVCSVLNPNAFLSQNLLFSQTAPPACPARLNNRGRFRCAVHPACVLLGLVCKCISNLITHQEAPWRCCLRSQLVSLGWTWNKISISPISTCFHSSSTGILFTPLHCWLYRRFHLCEASNSD